jgi:hypothetical protein
LGKNTQVGSLSSLGDGWELIKVRKTERGIKEVYFRVFLIFSGSSRVVEK